MYRGVREWVGGSPWVGGWMYGWVGVTAAPGLHLSRRRPPLRQWQSLSQALGPDGLEPD